MASVQQIYEVFMQWNHGYIVIDMWLAQHVLFSSSQENLLVA